MTKTSRASGTASPPPTLHQEILGFPAHLLAQLPLPVALWLEVPGAPVPVCFTTAASPADDSAHGTPSAAEAVFFHREELTALVVAAEAGRLWRKDLLGLCFEKWRRPALRVTATDTLAGARPGPDAEPWSLGQVLAALGASLASVELAEAPSVPRSLSAAA